MSEAKFTGNIQELAPRARFETSVSPHMAAAYNLARFTR